MGSESNLWKTLRKKMSGYWKADRIENIVSEGMPDVNYIMTNGRTGWMELKYIPEWPKRSETKIRINHFTPQQKAFFRRRGMLGDNVYIMIQVENEYILLSWKEALLIGTLNRQEMIEKSIYYSAGTLDGKNLAKVLF